MVSLVRVLILFQLILKSLGLNHRLFHQYHHHFHRCYVVHLFVRTLLIVDERIVF